MQKDRGGQIITFYSYKGGTGRSMALANVACLLAQQPDVERVLAIDWDLEAPGLHRYFQDLLLRGYTDEDIKHKPGMLDFVWSVRERLGVPPAGEGHVAATDPADAGAVLDSYSMGDYVLKVELPFESRGRLDLLKAGCFDEGYSRRVNTMPWEPLYQRCPGFFREWGARLARDYDYVLIDSRTGLTDISGICTMLMPEKLVTVFTPNRQSLSGVLDLARRALDYRQHSPDLRPLIVFPLPSRIDVEEDELRKFWRHDPEEGYEPQFSKLFCDVYALDSCDMQRYFDETQIPHRSKFSYGERLSVLEDRLEDKLALAPLYAAFAQRLMSDADPWEEEADEAPPGSSVLEVADAWVRSLPEDDLVLVRRSLMRLVRPAAQPGGADSMLTCTWSELGGNAETALRRLMRVGVVAGTSAPSGEAGVHLSEEALRNWKTLRTWIDEDREFLQWRDSLRTRMPQQLTGLELIRAEQWQAQRGSDLDEAESQFIRGSRDQYDLATARSLASYATSEMMRPANGEAVARVLLLAAESLKRRRTLEGDLAIRDAIATTAKPLAVLSHPGRIEYLATRLNQNIVMTAVNGVVRVWKPPYTDPEMFQVEAAVCSATIDRDGSILVVFEDTGHVHVVRDGVRRANDLLPTGTTFGEFNSQDRLICVHYANGRIYEVSTGFEGTRRILGLPGPIRYGRWSMDRRWLCLTLEEGNDLLVWDSEMEGEPVRFEGGPFTLAGFSASGKYLAAAGADNTVRVWRRETKELLLNLRHSDPVDRIIFGRGDVSVITLCGKRTAQIHPLETTLATWKVRSDKPVQAVAATSDHDLLALADSESAIRLIDLLSGRDVLRTAAIPPVTVLRFMEGGARLVSGSEDGSLRIWDTRPHRQQIRLDVGSAVWDVGFAGDHVLVAATDGHAHVYDARYATLISTLPASANIVSSVARSADGRWTAVASNGGRTWLYEGESYRELPCSSTAVAFSPDNELLVSAGWDGSVEVFRCADLKKVSTFSYSGRALHAVFSPDGKYIACGGDDGEACVMELGGPVIARFAHHSPVRAVAFSPDGRSLLTGSQYGNLRVFRLASREMTAILFHGVGINAIAVSNDGRYGATAGKDDKARIWDLKSQLPISEVAHEGEVTWLAFSPDDKMLATASSDGTVGLWLWRTEDLLQEAQKRVPRGFTREEWSRYMGDEPYPSMS